MITIITGVPGSGKTYFAVDMISKLKDQSKVLHNVDGLKKGTKLDDVCLRDNISPIDLFRNDYHQGNEEYRGWLFVIDECQTLFPKNFKLEEVQRFFQLHRHYGIDVVLLSQDYKLISPSISLLAEYQYRAVADVANPLPKTFLYKKMVGYEEIGKKMIRHKKKVFNLYKTADFDQKETRKKSRPMLWLFGLAVIVSVFAFWKLYGFRDGLNSQQPKTDSAKPMTMQEKEALASSGKNSGNYSGSKYGYSGKSHSSNQYPVTHLNKLGGVLLPLNTVQDSRGKFYLFMGTLWPSKDFPYTVVNTPMGEQALVSLDIYSYVMEEKRQIAMNSTYDPNETYLNESFSGNEIAENTNKFGF